jgi:hypothetical protein
MIKLAEPFTFVPENYLVMFEASRLEFDYMGALCQQTVPRQKMMAGLWFITRVLIRHVLLDAHHISQLQVRPNSTASANLKVIAGIIQSIVLLTYANVGTID